MRLVAAVAAALALVSCVPAAHAQDVHLTARDGARVRAVVPSSLRGEHLRLTVDGQHTTVVRRPATFSVDGLTRQNVTWHRLRVHGRHETASARFAVGSRRGRHSPTLVLTHAPARKTAATAARFEYSASGGRVSCTIDGQPTRCTPRAARVSVGPGRHVFGVQARSGKGVTFLAYRWRVSGTTTAVPPPAEPAPDPAPAHSAPSTSAPATAPSTDGDGESAAATPSGYRLLLSDDFDGSSLNTSNWGAYGPNWPGNGGNGIRDGSAVSVGGGLLTITAQMVGGKLISGAVASRASMTSGRVEFRVRVDPDSTRSTSGVVLMWPDSENWPIDGETDIFETGDTANRTPFHSFVHYGARNQQVWFGHNADGTQWQTMAMEWTPTSLRFYRDGALEGETTDPAVIPRASQHLVVQLDAVKPSMSGTVRMQVDYVRMYAPA